MRLGKKKGPVTAQAVLAQFFQGLGAEEKFEEYSFFADWENVVGEGLAKRIKPTVIRDGVLWANVPNSVFLQDLHFRSPQICRDINGYVGRQVVKSIRFRVGKVDRPKVARQGSAAGKVDSRVQALTAEEEARVDALVGEVEDPGLRESMKSLIRHDYQYKKGQKLKHDS